MCEIFSLRCSLRSATPLFAAYVLVTLSFHLHAMSSARPDFFGQTLQLFPSRAFSLPLFFSFLAAIAFILVFPLALRSLPLMCRIPGYLPRMHALSNTYEPFINSGTHDAVILSKLTSVSFASRWFWPRSQCKWTAPR